MQKLRLLSRAPWMYDYNLLVTAVNEIIDKLSVKIDIKHYEIKMDIDNLSFFKWKEVDFPYVQQTTIHNYDDLQQLLKTYELAHKDSKAIEKIIRDWNICVLNMEIHYEEKEKQEIIFKTLGSTVFKNEIKKTEDVEWGIVPLDKENDEKLKTDMEQPKKKGRPKKDLNKKQKDVEKNKWRRKVKNSWTKS